MRFRHLNPTPTFRVLRHDNRHREGFIVDTVRESGLLDPDDRRLEDHDLTDDDVVLRLAFHAIERPEWWPEIAEVVDGVRV